MTVHIFLTIVVVAVAVVYELTMLTIGLKSVGGIKRGDNPYDLVDKLSILLKVFDKIYHIYFVCIVISIQVFISFLITYILPGKPFGGFKDLFIVFTSMYCVCRGERYLKGIKNEILSKREVSSDTLSLMMIKWVKPYIIIASLIHVIVSLILPIY